MFRIKKLSVLVGPEGYPTQIRFSASLLYNKQIDLLFFIFLEKILKRIQKLLKSEQKEPFHT